MSLRPDGPRVRAPIVALCLGFLLGGVAQVLRTPVPDVRPPTSESTRLDPDVRPGGASAGDSDRTDDGERTGVRTSTDRPGTDTTPRGSAPDAAKGPERTIGDGVVEGVVVISLVGPLEGAVVGWRPEGSAMIVRTAGTDFLGRFRLDALPEGPGTVVLVDTPVPTRPDPSVQRSEGELAPDAVTPSIEEPPPFVRIGVDRLHDIVVELRHPDGSAPETAVIEVLADRFEWRPGRVLRCGRLDGERGQHGETFFHVEVGGARVPVHVAIVEDRIERPIVVDLPWPGGIQVDLGSEDGPVDADGYVAALPPGPVPDGAWLKEHGHAAWISGDTGPIIFTGMAPTSRPWDDRTGRGRIAWPGLPPATYLVGVAHRGRTVEEVVVVEVGRTTVEVSLDLPSTIEAAVSVEVLAPDGTPTPALIGMRRTDDRSAYLQFTESSDPDGSRWILPGDAILDTLANGDGITAIVESEEYGVREVPFDGGPLVVHYDEPARLRFTIIDENAGEGVPDEARAGTIAIVARDGTHLATWWIGSSIVTPPLPIAEVEFIVRGRNGMTGDLWMRGQWHALVPGENHVTVRVPRRHSLFVHPATDRRRSPFLRPLDEADPRRMQFASRVADGVFHYHGLAPGEYALLWPSERDRWMPVTIPRDRTVTLAPRPIEAFRVAFSPSEGPGAPDADGAAVIARSALRDGDIIAVGPDFPATTLLDAHSPARLPFPVLRDGVWIEVESSTAELRALEGAGMVLLPAVP